MRNAAPAMMKADAVAPDPFDRQSDPVADTLHNQGFYSTDFLSVLSEQARPSQRVRAVPPIRPHLSDDARHAPTLAAGAVACVLVAGIGTAFWIALVAGMAPLGGKSGLPRVEIAQTPLGIADPPAGERATLPAGIALLSGRRDALSSGSALQAWLDATLLLAYSPAQLGIVTAARLTTAPATHPAAPALENEAWPREHEAEPSPMVVPSSDVRLSNVADQPPAFPASAQARSNARPEERRGGNENGKQARPTSMPLSFTTASHPAPAGDLNSAPDIAPAPTAQTVAEASPSREESNAAEPSASGVSHSEGHGGKGKGDGGEGSEGPGDKGKGDGGESSKGASDKGKGGGGEASKGAGDKGKGEGGEGSGGSEGPGDKGKGDGGEGSKGGGDKGKGGGGEGSKGKGGGDKGSKGGGKRSR